ncbi:NIF3-like protein 1 [Dendronephthya gigantea]|uniref:NIF3-like protein 1 n=1 Tax=Dendronephthya gigantea TaxID=151771 RepID=UPI00106BD6AA|nr:NIF3-like protein 1 [Dendronephthya gigantea]
MKRCQRYLRYFSRSCQSLVKGMELREIVCRLEDYAPLPLAESWDNVGLLVEPLKANHLVRSILLTNDLTEAVMDEAIEKNTNMILSYHPPIFSPLKTLTRNSWKERVILKAIENKVAIYSPHTAFDAVTGGVNDWLASGLGKGMVKPLRSTLVDGSLGTHMVKFVFPGADELSNKSLTVDEIVTKLKQAEKSININVRKHVDDSDVSINCNAVSLGKIMTFLNSEIPEVLKSTNVFSLAKIPLQDTGVGRLCTLEEAVSVETLVKRIKDHLKLDRIRFASAVRPSCQNGLVKTIAICAGSGGSVLKGIKADMYLTGEMSHHDILDAVSCGIHVVLGEHSNTERGFLNIFSHVLYNMLEHKVTIHDSNIDKDPIQIV